MAIRQSGSASTGRRPRQSHQPRTDVRPTPWWCCRAPPRPTLDATGTPGVFRTPAASIFIAAASFFFSVSFSLPYSNGCVCVELVLLRLRLRHLLRVQPIRRRFHASQAPNRMPPARRGQQRRHRRARAPSPTAAMEREPTAPHTSWARHVEGDREMCGFPPAPLRSNFSPAPLIFLGTADQS